MSEQVDNQQTSTDELKKRAALVDKLQKKSKTHEQAQKTVRKTLRTIEKTSSFIPSYIAKCKACRHPQHDEMYRDKLRGLSNKKLAEKYFPDYHPPTVMNTLGNHWRKHIQTRLSLGISRVTPVVDSTTKRPSSGATTSLERIFSKDMKEQVNALANIEAVIINLAEKLNILEDIFLSVHINQPCRSCGRSAATDKHLTQMLRVIDRFVKVNEDWLRIKNPKDVMRILFVQTFLRFVKSMMSHYSSLLLEKTQIIRQAVNDFASERISLQLMLKRIAEVEDLGVQVLAERSIKEMREIQEYIETQFARSAWGTPTPITTTATQALPARTTSPDGT